MIQIIPFEGKYSEDFKSLNQEWLTDYGLMETHDMEVIMDPQGTILEKGGYIFLAAADGVIVGSAGLMKASDETYELVKLAVAPTHQGMGIGKLLIEKCMDKAKELGARKLFLFS